LARKKKKRKHRSQQPATAPAVSSVPDAVDAALPPPAPASIDEAPVDESPAAAAPPEVPAEVLAEPVPNGPPRPTAGEGAPVVEDLDDLDLDDAEGSYESLVAAVAGLEDEPPARPSGRNGRPPDADVEVEEVHDLDDDGAAASVDRLIAQVGRGRPAAPPPNEPEDDIPVIDLDDDVPAVPARATSGPAAQPTADMERLARAAAAGALDDPDPPPIPLDLGYVSTPEARARLLAEALAHAEHKEARYRVPLADQRRVSRLKSAAASVLIVAAGVVALAPPAWVQPEPPAVLSEGVRARGIRLALLLQAHQVEAYRVRTHQLPASLDDLPVKLDGVRYARSGRSYQLVGFTPDGEAIVYDAADPSPPFRVLEGALAPLHGGP
jgi:hypothetical protein